MNNLKGNPNTKAKNKYNAKTYDNLRIIVKKGEKATITQHAKKRNESINGFVNRAILETILRDKEGEINESM